MWGDFDVARHISGKPSTAEESWARMLRYAGLWHFLGYGYWVLEEKATGKFLGEVGFANFHREMDPPVGRPAGGGLGADARRRMARAMRPRRSARRSPGRMQNLKTPVVCILAPENPASMRVAEKSGFVKQGRGHLQDLADLDLSPRASGAIGAGVHAHQSS